jgi:hypothetical protein
MAAPARSAVLRSCRLSVGGRPRGDIGGGPLLGTQATRVDYPDSPTCRLPRRLRRMPYRGRCMELESRDGKREQVLSANLKSWPPGMSVMSLASVLSLRRGLQSREPRDDPVAVSRAVWTHGGRGSMSENAPWGGKMTREIQVRGPFITGSCHRVGADGSDCGLEVSAKTDLRADGRSTAKSQFQGVVRGSRCRRVRHRCRTAIRGSR